MRSGALGLPGVGQLWGEFRRRQLHREYHGRREYYAAAAERLGLSYREADIVASIRRRLTRRGYRRETRRMGEVHTFAFVPRLGWHVSLLPDLEELGKVTVFDYVSLGYSPEAFGRADRQAASRRREMNARALAALREAHVRHAVDWVFVYASGLEIRRDLIREIVETLGVPVVNMCLDDKHSWTGRVLDGQRCGQIDLAEWFDLNWTSARVACEWYLVEGGRPIYMPEGFDARRYRPMQVAQDIPVSFIGAAYGFRPAVVEDLRRHGIPIAVFGRGWHSREISQHEQVEVLNRSIINLGMGGIGYSEKLTNVKGRDFEIPGTGGGVYLTTFNADLARHFIVGEEILCYGNRDEMLELIRQTLANPEAAREMAGRARARCLAEHRWLHRYSRICRILGILADDSADQDDTPRH